MCSSDLKTKDGHYVLMHDQTIDRTTNGKGKVSNYTLHQIQRFYLKDKNDSLTEYRIPTLDTILKLTNGKIILNIDKSGGHFSELTQLIDSLNCADHIILKGTGDGKIFKALNNQDSTSIYYMPIFSNNSKIDTFLVNYHPPLLDRKSHV